jgi:CBS domain-containing protein
MKVCQILVKQGCVDEDSIEKALRIQVEHKKEIGEILVEMGAIKEYDLTEALNFQFDLRAEKFTDKVTFLQQTEPFHSLTSEELGEIAKTMEWNLYGPGEYILKQGSEAKAFSVVKNGLAKIYIEKDGGETVMGFLGEGECCGATGLLSGGINPSNVVAIEQTLCLSQDGESFAATMVKYPRFVTFFNELIVRQTKKMLTKLLTTGTGTVSQVEPFLYNKQVRDLISSNQVFCDRTATIREAGRKLIDQDGHTVVVLDEDKRLIGTVGLKRLVEASLLENRDAGQPIEEIMEKDFHVIGAESYFFDALHAMMKNGTDKLIVVSKDRPDGVLTSLDLLKFRGREVLSLIRTIDDARSFAELDGARRDVESVLRALMTDGALASHACKIVSELNDKITGRVIRLVEEELGPPPSPYAWLGLGSEGRKEQTLLTDQDNAILFDEFRYARKVEGAEEYFRAFADKVVHGLNDCGFPLCKGNIMATNPKYFGDLPSWKEKTGSWIGSDAEQGKDLLDIYTFLDFRVVYGNELLEKALKAHVIANIRETPGAISSLAQPIVFVPMPLGFFKGFIVEKNGKYKNTVNIKTHGLLPLTTCAKLLAFHYGIGETNTLERLRRLTEEEVIPSEAADALEQAFETFLTLKIQNNLTNLDEGRDFSNNINPALLTAKQKQLLKEAFLAVSQFQKITKERLNVID